MKGKIICGMFILMLLVGCNPKNIKQDFPEEVFTRNMIEAIDTSIELINNNQSRCAMYVMDYGFRTQLWALRNYNRLGVDEFYDTELGDNYDAWFLSEKIGWNCINPNSENCKNLISDLEEIKELLYPKSDLDR